MTKFVVCPRCEGEGKHVNPSIDGNGLSSEFFDEMGDDFREDYFSGVYDVTCHECKGQRVIKAPEALTPEEIEEAEWQREYEAEVRMEQRMLGEY